MYDKSCKNCGATLREFYRTYMLGCPECYKAFETEIISTLKKTQGKSVHVGKNPNVESVERQLLAEYNGLLAEKEIASAQSRFDEVAELARDIMELREELERRGIL